MTTSPSEGESLFAQGRFDEAEQGFRRQLAEDPKDLDALNNLAVIAHARGNADEAERLLTEALAVDPKSRGTLANLASLYLDLLRWPEAARILEGLVALDPRDTWALNQLAVIRLNRDQSALARDAIMRSLEVDPDQPALRQMLERLG